MTGNTVTRDDLRDTFLRLGLRRGGVVMLHSSLSEIGFVVNGALDVINAILDVIGEDGTFVVPTHTGQLTDPADWQNPAVPGEDIERVRASMEAFDPRLTAPRNRGIVPQTFLMYPKVFRSSHPLNSVAACGRHSQLLTSHHPLDESEGPASPTGVLYDLGGSILLLGVGLEACTGLHLAEFLAETPYLKETKIKVLVHDEDGRRFHRLRRYPTTSKYFNKIRPDLVAIGALRETSIGNTIATLVDFAPAIDLAVKALRNDPLYLISE